jgi:hypothetical protein
MLLGLKTLSILVFNIPNTIMLDAKVYALV